MTVKLAGGTVIIGIKPSVIWELGVSQTCKVKMI